jgi:t-SNARE complex subunit (syntaxin)
MIDQIETHVEVANLEVERANVKLTDANHYAAEARKKKWMVFLILLVVLAIAAGVIAYFVMQQAR